METKNTGSTLARRARSSVKWLVIALVAGFVVYRVKFAPVHVEGHRVALGPVVAEVMGTGTLEARVKTTISPRLQERLAEVLVDQNDRVTCGQLLARLDDGELRQQVEVSTAALAAAEASLERVKIDEARARAVEQQARVEQQRASELLATQAASRADYDKALERFNVAEADVKRSMAAIVESERQVAMARQTLLVQKERLGFTQILSPYDGLVVRRDRDPGGVVVPGSSLLQLISTERLWVSAWVDETAMAQVAPGQPARIVFRSEPSRSYEGQVARLGLEADRETREFLVDVDARALPKNWAVGQRAEVYIETGRNAATLALPARFVAWRAGTPGVFVAARGRAVWRALELGLRGRDRVEVATGLAAGDAVCRPEEGKPPLEEGQRISLR